ncbi:MAG: gliding motility-associated C-terminal domain-containing protein [Chitinophagales bacterium]
MKQILLLLTICLCFVLSQTVHAQTVCPDPLPDNYNTTTPGCTICDFPFTGSNYDYTVSGVIANGDYGCGNLIWDNDQFFVFIANDPCVSFTVDAYNCNANTVPPFLVGLQGFIFDLALTTTYDCHLGCCMGGPGGSGCDADSPAFTIATCGLTVGTAYYLIIDGCAGSECDYTVSATGTQGGDFVTISPTGPFCTDEGMVTLEGSPATGSTGTGVWTGDVNANGEFDATALGAGNYSATYTFTNTYGCEGDQTLNFVIGEPPVVSIDPVNPLCTNSLAFNLSASPVGGTWGGVTTDGVFAPAIIGTGNHSVTYTVVDGGCVVTEEIFITVNANPIVDIGPLSSFICAQDEAVDLIATPAGGIWSGNVNANGTINPALGEGSYSATYTFTDANNCSGSDIINFDIFPAPTVEILPQASLCQGDTITALIGIPDGGIWAGDVNENGEIDPAILGEGDFVAMYEITDSNGCTGTANLDFTIFPLPIVEITPLDTVCQNDPITTLTVSLEGGTWSGNVDENGGFDPAILGAGDFTAIYEYTDENACSNSDTLDFTIQPIPIVSIEAVGIFCEDDGVVLLTANPTGGVWKGAISETGEFDPQIAGIGTHTITYTFTDSFGCAEMDEISIEVFANPIVTFLSPSEYCPIDELLQLEAEPIGGTWSGDVDSNGEINPNLLGAGDFTAIYTFADSNNCTATNSLQFTIFAEPTITFDNTGPWCLEASAQTIVAEPSGGIFSGAADPTGEVVPQDLGAGFHDVNYLFTDENGCITDTTFAIEVSATVTIQIDSLPPLCSDGAVVQLSANPTGGTWSGAASATGEVDPVALGVGSHTVTYEVTDADGCMFSGERNIEVIAPTNIEFLSTEPFCLEDVTTIVEATPTGGLWSGDVNEFGEFNPTTLGSGVHDATYTYTDFAGCVTTESFTFTIAEPLEIVFDDSVFCQSETGLVTLNASPSNGTWSGDIVSPNGEIDPSILDLGEYVVTYTALQLPEGCSVSEDLTVSIIGVTDLEIVGDTSFCQTSGIQTFTATPSGGTWSGVADALGNVDVSALSVGTHEVIYTATSDEGCVSTVSQEITIAAPPTANLSGSPTMCEGDEANLEIVLTGIAPWTVTYTLEGGTETSFTIDSSPYEWTVNQGGEYVLVSVEDANGCADSAIGTATMTELPPLQLVNISSNCNGTNTGFIVQFEIIGGDPASYTVSGIAGNLSSDAPYVFTSEDIPTGDTANFTVSDDSPCDDISDAVTVLDCSCETDAGSLQVDGFEVCVTETVTVFHNADEFLDENDTLLFVLYAGTPNNVETVLVLTDGTTFGFDDALMDAGVTYYIAAVAGDGDLIDGIDLGDSCLDYSTGIPVLFNALPTASLGADQTICEGDEVTFVLELEGEAPFTVTLNGGIVLTDIPNGHEYTISPTENTTIEVEMVSDANCEDISTNQVSITVNTPPSAELTPEVNICNTDQNNDPTTLNLNDLITSGDATGTWVDLDASGAIGTLPNLDFNGVTAGDYTFEYTTAIAQAPCTDVSYVITVQVNDCSCPDVSTLGAGPFCNDNATLDLATITSTSELGTWTITNAPANATATITDNTFNGDGSVTGDYELTFTLTETPPAGCPGNSVQTISIAAVVSAGTISEAIQICNDGVELDLLEQLTDATIGGTWTDVSANPATGFLNGGILTTENIASGTYNFVYEVAADAPCLGDSEEVVVEIDNPVSAGSLLQNVALCDGTDTTVNLFDLIENFDLGGTWTDVSPSPASGFNANGELTVSSLDSGTYLFEYAVNSNGICTNEQVTVEVRMDETPIADAGETSLLTCDEPTAMIGGTGSSTGANIIYLWSGNVEDSIAATTMTNFSGIYTLTVTDSQTGCAATDSVTITQEGAIPILSAVAFEVSCFGVSDGRIEVESVTSGVEPFQYSLDGDELGEQTVFEGLEAGSHTVEVVDANGCTDALTFEIVEPEELTVSLVLNVASNVIQLGDSVQIVPTLAGAFSEFNWTPLGGFEACDVALDSVACLNPWVQPTENTTYMLSIADETGCTAAASIDVLVETEVKVIVPTAFSPNGDGINDELRLFANSSVSQVQTFMIFDRWGEKVFEQNNFDPNDDAAVVAWDGVYKGKEMGIGVFVFYAMVEFRDGSFGEFQGNVSLVR